MLMSPYDPHAPRRRRVDAGIPRKPRSGRLNQMLTGKEMLLIAMASEGKLNKEIAEEMITSEATVKEEFCRIYKRTGYRNRCHLVAQFVRESLVQ